MSQASSAERVTTGQTDGADGQTARPAYAPVRGLPGLTRCRVMAVINVTPDSFSDGGAFEEPEAAVRHGLGMLAAGADILDVGGESTRPGAERVSAEEEWRRVEPVVSALASAGAIVSIDTMRRSTAERALAAGAQIINDVSGGLGDRGMVPFVAEAEVPYVVMHWRGPSSDMASRAVYTDVVAEVCAELRQRVEAVVEGGVNSDRIIIDPGLGFAKTGEHNWSLLAHLDALLDLGRPVLLGASRKSFLGALLGTTPDEPRPMQERDDATAAISAIAAHAGAWGVRVHEVQASADAVRVAAAVRNVR